MQTTARFTVSLNVKPAHGLRRRVVAWLLLAAMLLAPWLAQVHSSLHGMGGNTHAGASATTASAAAGGKFADKGPERLERLFGSHDNPTDCRLYDQLGHADLIAGIASPCLPVVPPAVQIAFLTGEAVARFAALFDARGPPPLR